MRRRLDAELVRRGLCPSREQAQSVIDAGRVRVRGTVATKPATLVAPGDPLAVVGDGPRFVGRGGEKLDAALDRFGVLVDGRRAVDLGSSTGGFTDCLLSRGAAEVVAVDVGRGQLHARLRSDPRVRVMESTNARHLSPADAGGPFDVVVGDLSFISLRTVAGAVLALAAPGADVVLLVKPQFEVGRVEASKGRGVVRDPTLWQRAVVDVCVAYAERGATIMGAMPSPLRGADGNVEFLVHLRPEGAEARRDHDVAALASAAVASVGEAGA